MKIHHVDPRASFQWFDKPARLVHYLDVGGALVPEAAGFEAVLAGLRDRSPDDDALLAATSPVLDALYQHFATSEIKNRT